MIDYNLKTIDLSKNDLECLRFILGRLKNMNIILPKMPRLRCLSLYGGDDLKWDTFNYKKFPNIQNLTVPYMKKVCDPFIQKLLFTQCLQ